MANYSIITRPFELRAGISDATGGEVAQQLAIVMGKLLQDVKKAISIPPFGSGCEIISHELTRIERHLIVSFLIRQP